MSALAFGFTKLVVTGIARSERFYSTVFGMKPVDRVTADEHAYALEEVMLSLTGGHDSHLLIITRYLRRPTPPAGSAWTGFLVGDIEATLRSAQAEGGVVEVPVHKNEEYRTLAAIIADPDGHLIEVIQMMPS